ncbi:MAG: hypothetical protein LBT97_10380 [Planctomycetota bacterium]|jgi:chaperonin cofactor prefoldin|nr:hypothetical protein [Planctomycetota bacterium]
MNFPLWQFGKSRAGDGGCRGGYAVLAAAPEFTGQRLAILRRISEDAAWRPKGKDACPPATACWPLDADNWLLLRFLDDGMDDHHRPNTMRIEAVLAEHKSWEELYRLLPPEAWPAPAPDGATAIDLTPVDQPGEKPAKKPAAPVLYADSGELTSTLFTPLRSRTPDPKPGPGASPIPHPAPPARKMTGAPARLDHPNRKSPWRWISLSLLAALSVSIVMTMMKQAEVEYWQRQDERSEAEATRLKNEIAGLNNANRDLETQKENLRRDLGKLQHEVARLERAAEDALPNELSQRYNLLKERIASLSASLSAAQKDMEEFKNILRSAVATDGRRNDREPGIERAEGH